MIWNSFGNGLSETREAVADGYFWDSESVETRILPGVRLAKYKEIREWSSMLTGSKKVMGLVSTGSNSNKDYFAFLRNGSILRYKVSDPGNYLSVANSYPSGLITDILETPRGVYAFWQQQGSTGTAVPCKMYYTARNLDAGQESLDYGTANINAERITFTANNAGAVNFYDRKFPALVDNQAIVWASKQADGKTGIYVKDYEDLIPLVTSAVTPSDYLPGTCAGITVQGEFLYVYMQDRLFYYAVGDLLNGRATELIPTGSIPLSFTVYDVQAGDGVDWVMTSNGIYQRNGLSFSLMSGQVFGIFNGKLGNSPLITAFQRGNETAGTKMTTFLRKSNFFKGGFAGSEYIDGDEETVFGNGQYYAYYDGSKVKLVQKGTMMGGTVDSPGYYPVTENQEAGYFAPSGKISSCRFYASSFQQVKRLKALKVSFLLNGGTIALDIRTNKNETFTQVAQWSGSSNECGAEIKANSIIDKEIQWVEYRVRLTRGDETSTPIFYGIIPLYEDMIKEF